MKPETAAWIASANEDWDAALLLQEAHLFSSAVFHAHLHIEKLLKALIVEIQGRDGIRYTHNLPRLLVITGVEAPRSLSDSLENLSPHSIYGRYAMTSVIPEIVYTGESCDRLLSEANEVATWLKQRLT